MSFDKEGLCHTKLNHSSSAKVNALPAPCSSGQLQSQTQEELDALSLSPGPSASLRINSASGIPSAKGATIARDVQGGAVTVISFL